MMFEFGNIGALLFIVIFAVFEHRLIATLWRNIGTSTAVPEIAAPLPESPAPREQLLLGRTITDEGSSQPLAIPEELRSRHCYLIGNPAREKPRLWLIKKSNIATLSPTRISF